VPIWTAWTVLYFHLAATGWAPVMTLSWGTAPWFVLLFPLVRFWQSFHFFLIHKLIHVPVLFRHVHHLHHRNVNTGPWSGLAMHPAEHLLYFSSIAIHLVVPSHPLHVIFHLFALSVGALFSHAGFEKLLLREGRSIKAGSFHHQLHHRFFECNYGTEEVPMDRWFDSFHDGTAALSKIVRARKRLIFGTR
jgi:sterol desaturase/sphingolipid hydroxylase (fatty acid hydroxylase superfamily)